MKTRDYDETKTELSKEYEKLRTDLGGGVEGGIDLTVIENVPINQSGIKPVEYKVMVKPEEVKKFSPGGIELPQSVIDKDKFHVRRGVLVATGYLAFEGWGDIPQIGATVVYDRYAGDLMEGEDGEGYRLMNDKEICGVVG
jgi:chaperonin GroES